MIVIFDAFLFFNIEFKTFTVLCKSAEVISNPYCSTIITGQICGSFNIYVMFVFSIFISVEEFK